MHVLAISGMASGAFSHELQGHEVEHPGVSLIFVDARPGGGPSLHTHEYAEVIVILEGTATFSDGEREIEVGAGEVVVVGAGEPHAFTNTGGGPLRQIDIHVADRFATDWL